MHLSKGKKGDVEKRLKKRCFRRKSMTNYPAGLDKEMTEADHRVPHLLYIVVDVIKTSVVRRGTK